MLAGHRLSYNYMVKQCKVCEDFARQQQCQRLQVGEGHFHRIGQVNSVFGRLEKTWRCRSV